MKRIALPLVAAALVAGCGGNSADSPGAAVYQSQGCAGCHGADGGGQVGPALAGLYESEVEIEGHDAPVVADRAYLRESIVDPKAKIVKGENTPMPKKDLSDEDVELLVDYIISLEAGD